MEVSTAIYYQGEQVERLQKVANGDTSDNGLYLVEIHGRKVFAVRRKRLTADNGVEEIVHTATATQGTHIQPQLPLYRKTA